MHYTTHKSIRTSTAIAIIAFAIICAAGCAAGRADDGAIILGARLADFPETAEQAAKFAAGFLGEPWSTLAKAAIGLIFGGSAAVIAARRAKQREDHAWDEAEARAYSRTRPINRNETTDEHG